MIRIAKSPIHGRGVFAAQDIPAGAKILAFNGHRTKRTTRWDCFLIDGERWRVTNEMRFLNRSEAPNSEFRGIDLHAARHIEAGEEITVRYVALTTADQPRSAPERNSLRRLAVPA